MNSYDEYLLNEIEFLRTQLDDFSFLCPRRTSNKKHKSLGYTDVIGRRWPFPDTSIHCIQEMALATLPKGSYMILPVSKREEPKK